MRFRTTTVVALSLLMVFGMAMGVPTVWEGSDVLVEHAAAHHGDCTIPHTGCCYDLPTGGFCID